MAPFISIASTKNEETGDFFFVCVPGSQIYWLTFPPFPPKEDLYLSSPSVYVLETKAPILPIQGPLTLSIDEWL